MKTLSPNKQLLVSCALFVFLLIASLLAAGWVPEPFRLPVVLLPLVASYFIVQSMLAAIRAMDELQRYMHLEAFGFAFGGMFMLLITETLLGAIVPEPLQSPGMYIFYMAMMWAVGLFVAHRKYS